jgi:cysteine desulfurase
MESVRSPNAPTSSKQPIYLDYAATTPIDPRVVAKMLPFLTGNFGNAASRSHRLGWQAEEAIEAARAEVAALVNCEPREIVLDLGRHRVGQPGHQGRCPFSSEPGGDTC